MIRNWRPDQVKAMVKAKLVSNADGVGIFLKSEAKRRLDNISSPDTDRDKNYRAFLSKWLLTYAIDVTEKYVEVAVGMRIGAIGTGSHYHGFYIETGSSTAPAHPYLRPAVFTNGKEIIQLFGVK